MMKNYRFSDMWTAHVDVFQIGRHDFGDMAAAATGDDDHVYEIAFLEHHATVTDEKQAVVGEVVMLFRARPWEAMSFAFGGRLLHTAFRCLLD